MDLRDANTGITLIGWVGAQSEVTFQAAGGSKMRASTKYVPANYFKTLGVVLARGAGFDASANDGGVQAPPRHRIPGLVNHLSWTNH